MLNLRRAQQSYLLEADPVGLIMDWAKITCRVIMWNIMQHLDEHLPLCYIEIYIAKYFN